MATKRILFIRQFHHRTGGHVTVHDYFEHTLAHPHLDPYVYFTPDSDMSNNDIWKPLPLDRLVSSINYQDFDFIFLGGDDWEHLPGYPDHMRFINVILHPRHATQKRRRRHLSRFAYRICNSEAVHEAIAPLANGPIAVIPNALDLTRFRPAPQKEPQSVFIWAGKNPKLGTQLAQELKSRGIKTKLQVDSMPQEAFALHIGRSQVLVTLPDQKEGFYRPGLEGMASGCAVVCSDALGNREYAVDGTNCLQPAFDDLQSHLEAVLRLLGDNDLGDQLRTNGLITASSFTLTRHRERYYDFISKYILD